ncbi:MAG: DUF4091 domain-containing protein [Verrucomicrobiae bacterium]|nr:DUF4091 domain-containing protein [Verrucomicrobiae bacterium]
MKDLTPHIVEEIYKSTKPPRFQERISDHLGLSRCLLLKPTCSFFLGNLCLREKNRISMFRFWLQDSLFRVFPWSRPRTSGLRLDVARGERFSFQAAVIAAEESQVAVRVSSPPGIRTTLRRVGFVPLFARTPRTPASDIEGCARIPGLVPDPLLPDTDLCLPRGSAIAWWISGETDPEVRPGKKQVRVTLTPERKHGGPRHLDVDLRVHPLRLRARKGFDVTHWFYTDALCDWYHVTPWSEGFWEIVRPYFRNLVAHGQNMVYIPVFTPPLDGVKRPTQLLGVRRTGKHRYAFDWRHVDRWIAMARASGISRFEWCHLVTQWGARHAIRIYEKKNGQDVLLWPPETPATGPAYRAFLGQYLPQLHRFLERHGLLGKSVFHLSDEPHGDEPLANYRQARAMLRELAPWMTVMDALSDIRFAREKLVDVPVPILREAKMFVDEGIPCWTYFCCAPVGRWLNRLLTTPLTKVRLSGWLFWRFQHLGFLHWGYNYWYRKQTRELIDPYLVLDGGGWPGWQSGDPFVVYPGKDGPIDSLRWEVFAESLEDYRLLQTLGVSPSSLADEFRDYHRFPRDPAWVRRRRAQLLAKDREKPGSFPAS